MCIAFKIHHPYLLNPFGENDIDNAKPYFNEDATLDVVDDLVEKSLLPVNELLAKKVEDNELQVRLVITGTLTELLKRRRPEAIASIKTLVQMRNVQMSSHNFYNSHSLYCSSKEKDEQLDQHQRLMAETFQKSMVPSFCSASISCSQSLHPIDYRLFQNAGQLDVLAQVIDAFSQYKHEIRNWQRKTEMPEGKRLLLKKLCSLEGMVMSVGDKAAINDWRRLQDVCYYLTESSEEEARLKNIIVDLEIRLIRMHLQKIKKRQKELPVIL